MCHRTQRQWMQPVEYHLLRSSSKCSRKKSNECRWEEQAVKNEENGFTKGRQVTNTTKIKLKDPLNRKGRGNWGGGGGGGGRQTRKPIEKYCCFMCFLSVVLFLFVLMCSSTYLCICLIYMWIYLCLFISSLSIYACLFSVPKWPPAKGMAVLSWQQRVNTSTRLLSTSLCQRLAQGYFPQVFVRDQHKVTCHKSLSETSTMLLSTSLCQRPAQGYFPQVAVRDQHKVTFHKSLSETSTRLLSTSLCQRLAQGYFPQVFVRDQLKVTFHKSLSETRTRLLSTSLCQRPAQGYFPQVFVRD